MVFQMPIAFKDSVFENIAIGLRYRHIPHDEIVRRVQEKLNESAPPAVAHEQPVGGRQQRIGHQVPVATAEAPDRPHVDKGEIAGELLLTLAA